MTIFPQLINLFSRRIKIEATTGRKCLETNKGVTSIFFININKQEAIGDISFPSNLNLKQM